MIKQFDIFFKIRVMVLYYLLSSQQEQTPRVCGNASRLVTNKGEGEGEGRCDQADSRQHLLLQIESGIERGTMALYDCIDNFTVPHWWYRPSNELSPVLYYLWAINLFCSQFIVGGRIKPWFTCRWAMLWRPRLLRDRDTLSHLREQRPAVRCGALLCCAVGAARRTITLYLTVLRVLYKHSRCSLKSLHPPSPTPF